MMKELYKIVDYPSFTFERAGRWKELYRLLPTLKEGQWIEVPLSDNDLAKNIALSIQQSARKGRKSYQIRTHVEGNRLWVTLRDFPVDRS